MKITRLLTSLPIGASVHFTDSIAVTPMVVKMVRPIILKPEPKQLLGSIQLCSRQS